MRKEMTLKDTVKLRDTQEDKRPRLGQGYAARNKTRLMSQNWPNEDPTACCLYTLLISIMCPTNKYTQNS